MTYAQTIDYLYTSKPAFHLVGASAYKPGLDNTYQLMTHLGNPHQRFRSVHVAGTNGKGSTSHLIAAVLQSQGYRVGLYTSPHLVDFRERIRVNGQMIPEEEVVRFVENHRSFLDELSPSFFETTMAMAFSYFAQQEVDIAVIEVGLGGRLDSTNIITPIMSVITNIGFDHTEFLGDTLAQIAQEKAGIIKPSVPCVIGETHAETTDVFLSRARACNILGEGLETTNCRIWFADQCGYMRKRRMKEIPSCQLEGYYQDKNQQTAYVGLQILRNFCGLTISQQAMAQGYAQVCSLTGLRGRWEQLAKQPLVLCDTGHNGHGFQYVSKQLVETLRSQQLRYPNAQLRIVFGMVMDKDIDVVLRLMPEQAIYYFTQPATSRAVPSAQLLSAWLALHTNHATCQSYTTVSTAMVHAKKDASPEDIIFVGGSNYVVGEVLSMEKKKDSSILSP